MREIIHIGRVDEFTHIGPFFHRYWWSVELPPAVDGGRRAVGGWTLTKRGARREIQRVKREATTRTPSHNHTPTTHLGDNQ